MEQSVIPADSYIQTYVTLLDLCLQGVISPSTLGIDTKKLDNAEAQREKEKATLYSRQSIVNALSEIIPDVVVTAVNATRLMKKLAPVSFECFASFGEYANPSFEAQVQTLSDDRTPMSIEAKVEELWGDKKPDEWKAEEVARIKLERGIASVEEPALGFGDGYSI